MLVQQRRKWKRFKDITTFLKRSAYRLSLAHWQTASLARIDIIWRRERIMKITQVLGKKYMRIYVCMYVILCENTLEICGYLNYVGSLVNLKPLGSWIIVDI